MSSIKDFKAIIDRIDKKQFEPIYFLEGEESYFIDKIADKLEASVLTESEKSFNFQILYGREVQILDLIAAAKRFPMMANHQLIIVREAQYLKGIEGIIDYISNPVPSTILVILYKGKKVSRATKLGKSLKQKGAFTSDRMRESEVASWLEYHIKHLGLQIQPQATRLLLNSLGTSLSKLSNELDKIKVNLNGQTMITAEIVSKNTGIDREYNVFELTKSLGQRNLEKSMRIVKYFASNPKDNPFILVLSNIFSYFKRVHMVQLTGSNNKSEVARTLGISPYFVDEYISAAQKYRPSEMHDIIRLFHEFDLRSKGLEGGSSADSELLTELVARIIK
ncbi:MAG: DNA polymerase-3 subunit delta [Bacteroidia bacterium]|jgi:DNA polymerase-3 subunit delta